MLAGIFAAIISTADSPLLTLVLLGKRPNQALSLAMILCGAGFTVALAKFGVPEPEYFIPGLSIGFILYYVATLLFPEATAREETTWQPARV